MPTEAPPTPDRAQLEQRASALRAELFDLGAKFNELRAKPDADRTESWQAELKHTSQNVAALDGELITVERNLTVLPQFEQRSGRGPSAATGQVSDDASVSLGRLVIEHEGIDAWRRNRQGIFEMQVGSSYFDRELRPAHDMRAKRDAVEVRGEPRGREYRAPIDEGDVLSVTGGKAFLPVGQPFLAPQAIDRLRLFVQDLIPGGNTNLPQVPYIRELNPRTTESGATSVPEGSAKPEVTATFTTVIALVKKIAAWLHLTDEIIEDAPTLMAYINARLPYMVDLAEERMYLRGNPSVNPNDCQGILTVPGIQTRAFAGDNATTLGMSISDIELVDAEVDGFVMNPVNYWGMVTRRTSGSGQYDSSNLPFGVGPQGAWGTPVVRTRQMATGQALAGAFRLGAQVLDRMDTNVRMGRINDDLIRNQQVVLAESRSTILIYRPDFFNLVTGLA